MLQTIIDRFSNVKALFGAVTGFAVMVALVMVLTPLFREDKYAKRMKSVSSERERLRQRERALMKSSQGKGLRQESNAYMKDVVERFSLSKWLHAEGVRERLASAGYRGPQAEIAFLFFRAVVPIAFVAASFLYFRFFDPETELLFQFGAAVSAMYSGLKAPELFLKNQTAKRQVSMRRAFPDALDLMLVCVEGGMSIDAAFRRVGNEIGVQSIPLAEEFALATAELNYLPDRRTAYNNLATRTGLPMVKQIATVLIQAEKYGTPLGQALRVTAQESRDARMLEAERVAAALPPKLTVPMILFFLPVLIVIVIAPAAIQIISLQ